MKKHRKDCLAYLVNNYKTWPAEGATWHTARTHCGYGWVFTPEQGWFLENELYDDKITEKDFLTECRKVQLSCSPESNGQSFLLRIESREGIACYTLTPDEFAKLVSGQLATGIAQD